MRIFVLTCFIVLSIFGAYSAQAAKDQPGAATSNVADPKTPTEKWVVGARFCLFNLKNTNASEQQKKMFAKVTEFYQCDALICNGKALKDEKMSSEERASYEGVLKELEAAEYKDTKKCDK
ncbi:MAG: hypothetical protein AB7E85_02600 [Pseudobdellovibrionaceae bacterium]